MVCVPVARVEIMNRAVPLLTGTAPEMAVGPSRKVTVPVAAVGETVAVNVVGDPAFTLSSGAVSVVVVEALTMVSASAGDVPPLKPASPLYCAVREWLPAASADVVKLAVPALRGTLPEMAVAPSKKVTLPVAEVGATLAVKVRAAPTVAGFAPAVRLMPTLALALTTATVCTNATLVVAATRLSPV